MLSNIPLYTEANRRMGFIRESDNMETAVADRRDLTKLEARPRCKIKQRNHIRRDQNACAKSERCAVRRKPERIRNYRRRKIVGRSRIETSLAIRIYVNGRRKEEIDPFTD